MIGRANRWWLIALSVALASDMTLAQQTPPPPQAQQATLLQQAAEAERARLFDRAIDRLYQVMLDQSRGGEPAGPRLQLARLLVLASDESAAILQAQAVHDGAEPGRPERQAAANLVTLFSRRLRVVTGAPLFSVPDSLSARGLPRLDEPSAIQFEPDGTFLLADAGDKKVFSVRDDSATVLSVPEATAAARLGADLIVAGKTGPMAMSGKGLAFKGTWSGRVRELRKVRAMAASSTGDVFIVDRDFDGVLRCPAQSNTCTPWGAPGRVRTMKIDANDLVWILDDRQPIVRLLDLDGTSLASVGPVVSTTKFERIADIAVDQAYGLYLLDAEERRIYSFVLRGQSAGLFTPELIGSTAIPVEGERAMRNPSAIGVDAAGTLFVAARGSASLLRFK